MLDIKTNDQLCGLFIDAGYSPFGLPEGAMMGKVDHGRWFYASWDDQVVTIKSNTGAAQITQLSAFLRDGISRITEAEAYIINAENNRSDAEPLPVVEELTLSQIREKRKELARKISGLLRDFTNEARVNVLAVDVNGGSSLMPVYKVEVEIDIN